MFINNTFKSRLSIIILSFYIFFEFGIHFNSLYAESGQNPPPQDRTQLSYRSQTFRPGDAVKISVYPDTSSFLNDIYNIDGNGNIFLPIRGKINVSNLSVIEFESYVKKNFAAYLRYPDVKVRPLIRVSLLGGFANPGLYYIDPDYTMWDLVHLAGGTLREDGLRKMKWERNRDIVEKNLIPFYEFPSLDI